MTLDWAIFNNSIARQKISKIKITKKFIQNDRDMFENFSKKMKNNQNNS